MLCSGSTTEIALQNNNPATVSHNPKGKITMKTNLKIHPSLKPQQVGDPSIPLAPAKIEKCLVRVIAAIGAITTTALTGSFYHSREIGDPLLLHFLSKGECRSMVMSMTQADRTSFYIEPVESSICLRINVTADKQKLWSKDLMFSNEGDEHDGLLTHIVSH